ncbi:MAG TPA: MFS transporter, partial [Opitutaceae bacterium]
ALFLATLRLWSLVPERTAHEAAAGTGKAPTTLANSFAGWLSPVLFALYAALEMSTGLWAASVLVVARGFATEKAAWCAAGFYGAITVGRVLVGFVVDRAGNRRVVVLGALVALAGSGLFIFARSEWLAALALGAIGLGFAPIYPGLMHEVPRRFAPEAAQTVIGRQSGTAYLGMAVLPAALGWLAQHSLESMPAVIAGGTLVLLLGIRRLDRLT